MSLAEDRGAEPLGQGEPAVVGAHTAAAPDASRPEGGGQGDGGREQHRGRGGTDER